MTDYYQIAQKLAASLPEFNGNVPSTAWNVLINRLKGAIPGVHSQAWPGCDLQLINHRCVKILAFANSQYDF